MDMIIVATNIIITESFLVLLVANECEPSYSFSEADAILRGKKILQETLALYRRKS